jgi:hypothetical protein
VSMTRVLQALIDEGYAVTPEIIAGLSPYKIGHSNRFGAPRSAWRESSTERRNPTTEYVEWLGGQASGPEAEWCLKLPRQCGGKGAYARVRC